MKDLKEEGGEGPGGEWGGERRRNKHKTREAEWYRMWAII